MLKLPAKDRLRQYELTFLVPGDFTSTEIKKTTETVSNLIKKVGGQVKETLDWGKKDLAYVIKKQGKKYHQAIYIHMLVELKAKQVLSLEKELLLLPDVIRYLLVIANAKTPTKLGQAKEIKPQTKK